MWFTSAQSSVSSRMYSAESGSTDSSSIWSLGPSSNKFYSIRRTRSWLLVGPWGRWYPPRDGFLLCGSGGILERHILAKWPVFLLMLHFACFAVHCAMCPCVKNPPHLQHSSLFVFVWAGCCCLVGCCLGKLLDVAPTGVFQFVVDDRKISFWFSCPLSLNRAKFSTWAAVRTSEKSSIWLVLLFIFAMKKSLMRSSSTFPRTHFEPNSRRRLKNVSRRFAVLLLTGICRCEVNVGVWMSILVRRLVRL